MLAKYFFGDAAVEEQYTESYVRLFEVVNPSKMFKIRLAPEVGEISQNKLQMLINRVILRHPEIKHGHAYEISLENVSDYLHD